MLHRGVKIELAIAKIRINISLCLLGGLSSSTQLSPVGQHTSATPGYIILSFIYSRGLTDRMTTDGECNVLFGASLTLTEILEAADMNHVKRLSHACPRHTLPNLACSRHSPGMSLRTKNSTAVCSSFSFSAVEPLWSPEAIM